MIVEDLRLLETRLISFYIPNHLLYEAKQQIWSRDRLQKDRHTRCTEWQRVTTNNKEWQRVIQRVTTSGTTNDNEWQGGKTSDNEWQRVVQRMATSDNEWHNKSQRVKMSDKEWQQLAMSDSKWEQWYSEWKRHSILQRMDDCNHFNYKKTYTATSRDGWLQLECSNKG